MYCDKNRAIEKRKPDHADGEHFYLDRNGFVYHKVTDIWSKSRMIKQPLIKIAITAIEEPSRQQKERCCREDGEEDTKYPQAKRNQT